MRGATTPPGPADPCRIYDVASAPAELGRLERVWSLDLGPAIDRALGERCYRALYLRASPCPGCPVFSREPRAAAREGGIPLPGPGPRLAVVSVHAADAATLRVSARPISQAMLGELLHARLRDLADGARLSGREREVLSFLYLGRSSREIAAALGIAARTVRFHQVNVLEKLGAASRLDLVRLLV
jgi:DNA-binding CsgD family transcriptional regulator